MRDTKPCEQKYLDKSGGNSILLREASLRFTKRPKSTNPKQRADLRAELVGRIAEGGWVPPPLSNEGG